MNGVGQQSQVEASGSFGDKLPHLFSSGLRMHEYIHTLPGDLGYIMQSRGTEL